MIARAFSGSPMRRSSLAPGSHDAPSRILPPRPGRPRWPARLLWVRRGDRDFAENRIRRILLPFILGWLAVFPVAVFMSAWSKTSSLSAAARYFTTGAFVESLHPGHLSFLEYLLVLYAVVYAGVTLIERLPSRILEGVNRAFRSALQSPWRPVIFAVPSFGVLCLMESGYLEDPPGFAPVPRLVLAYLVPFAFGWLLYLNRDLLPTFERRAWAHTGIAAALFAAYMLGIASPLRELGLSLNVIRAALGALILWLITFGLTGLFLRYASKIRGRKFGDTIRNSRPRLVS